MWVVVLEQRWRGACVGSTEDLIEAADKLAPSAALRRRPPMSHVGAASALLGAGA